MLATTGRRFSAGWVVLVSGMGLFGCDDARTPDSGPTGWQPEIGSVSTTTVTTPCTGLDLKAWQAPGCNGDMAIELAPGLVYHSIDSAHAEGAGNGVRVAARESLTVSGNDVVITAGDGRTTKFTLTGGTYVPDVQVMTKLTLSGTTYVHHLGGGAVANFTKPNSTYQLTTVVDANGNTTTLAYDSSDRLTSVTGPNGLATTYTYTTTTSGGKLTKITDTAGRETNITYDGSGRLSTVTYALSVSTTYSYSGTTNYLVRSVPSFGGGVDYSYYAGGVAYSVRTDAHSYLTEYAYTATTYAVASSSDHRPTTIHFDSSGVVSVVGANGDATTMVRDSRHRVTSTKDAYDNETTQTYNSTDDVLTVTTPDNKTTTFTYDSNHNVLTVAASGVTVTNTYNSFDQVLTSTVSTTGDVTTNTYDSYGNLTQTKFNNVNRGTATYTTTGIKGLVATATDEHGRTTTMTYDSYGNPATVTTHDSQVTTTTYTSAGQILTLVNPLGETTEWTYDALGRETEVRTTPASESKPGFRTVKWPQVKTTQYESGSCGTVIGSEDCYGDECDSCVYTYSEDGVFLHVSENDFTDKTCTEEKNGWQGSPSTGP